MSSLESFQLMGHRTASFAGCALLLAAFSMPVLGDDDAEAKANRMNARSAAAEQRSEANPTAGRPVPPPRAAASERPVSSGTSGRYEGGSGDGPDDGGYSRGDGGRDGHGYGRHHGRDGRGRRHYRPHGYGYPYGGYGYYGYHGYCRWCWWYPWNTPTIYVEAESYGGRNSGALDLDLSPERAQVYIDGRYAGVADDFDGFPAFLWLDEGTYDVVFYLPGYRTIARQYTLRPGSIIDIEDEMQPGESVRPEDLASKSTERRDERIRRNDEREAEVAARERAEEERARERGQRPREEQELEEKVGRLYLSLWPDDAAVYLDGHFLGTAGELSQLSAGLVVEPGEHKLEVVYPGYRTSQRTVSVPPGDRVELKYDLEEN